MRFTPRDLAILSKAAYAAGNRNQIEQILHDYDLDDKVVVMSETDIDDVVVRNKDTGNIVVAVRGTDLSNTTGNRVRDVSNWPAVALGWASINSRVQRIQKDIKKIQQDYPDSNIYLTGHSLGGWISSAIAEKTGLKAVVFNPASGLDNVTNTFKNKMINLVMGHSPHNVIVYTTNKLEKGVVDPASVLSVFGNSVVHHVNQKDGLDVHSIDNFVGEDVNSGNLDVERGESRINEAVDTRGEKRKKVGFDPAVLLLKAGSSSVNRYSNFSRQIPADIQELAFVMPGMIERWRLEPDVLHDISRRLHGVDAYGEPKRIVPGMKLKMYDDLGDGIWYSQTYTDTGDVKYRIFMDGFNGSDEQKQMMIHMFEDNSDLAAETFAATNYYKGVNRFIENVYENGVRDIQIVGHSLGGFRARVAIQDLASRYTDVNFTADILNGNLVPTSIFDDGLPSNASVNYHTNSSDVTNLKSWSFRKAEYNNGATHTFYPPSEYTFYPTNNSMMRTFKHHLLDSLHEIEIVKGVDGTKVVGKVNPKSYKRYGLVSRNRGNNNIKSRIYDAAELGGKIGTTVGAAAVGEGVATALDPYFHDGIAGDLEHTLTSNIVGGATMAAGKAGTKYFGSKYLTGRFSSFPGLQMESNLAATIAKDSVLEGGAFFAGGVAGGLSQYGTEKLMHELLKNTTLDKDTQDFISSLTGNTVGGAVGAATSIGVDLMLGADLGAVGGPLGVALGAGLGLLMGGIAELGPYVEKERRKEYQNEEHEHKKNHMGVPVSYLVDMDTDHDERQKRRDLIDSYIVELAKWRNSTAFSSYVKDITRQLTSMDLDMLMAIPAESLPSVDDIHKLFAAGQYMSAFIDKKKKKTITFYGDADSREINTVDGRIKHLLSTGLENGFYGFDNLKYVAAHLRKTVTEEGWMDQFVSGQWDDKKFVDVQQNLQKAASVLGTQRGEKEDFFAYQNRVHEALVQRGQSEVSPLTIMNNQFRYDMMTSGDPYGAVLRRNTMIKRFQEDHKQIFTTAVTKPDLQRYQQNIQKDMKDIYGNQQVEAIV